MFRFYAVFLQSKCQKVSIDQGDGVRKMDTSQNVMHRHALTSSVSWKEFFLSISLEILKEIVDMVHLTFYLYSKWSLNL